jgi:hypothetical protein
MLKFDPPSPWRSEQKGALLHGVGRYAKAIDAYKTMLVKLGRSPHPDMYPWYAHI